MKRYSIMHRDERGWVYFSEGLGHGDLAAAVGQFARQVQDYMSRPEGDLPASVELREESWSLTTTGRFEDLLDERTLITISLSAIAETASAGAIAAAVSRRLQMV